MATKITKPNGYPKPQIRETETWRLFSESDDAAAGILKKVEATNNPDADARGVDIHALLDLTNKILAQASSSIVDALKGTREVEALQYDTSSLPPDDAIHPASSAYIVNKLSCELACKCSGGGDASETTMVLFNTLSGYSWDAKLVLTLAAFAVNYGEYGLFAQLYNANLLARSVALLKQLPDIIEKADSLNPQFEKIKLLVDVVKEVANCVVKFYDVPFKYKETDKPPASHFMDKLPRAAYWTIHSLVACASLIASLLGVGDGSNGDIIYQELPRFRNEVGFILEDLQKLLKECKIRAEEMRVDEAYKNLKILFKSPHPDNLKILMAMVDFKDVQQTPVHLTKEKLRRKKVLLLISGLDFSEVEIKTLSKFYKDELPKKEDFEILWLPIVDEQTAGDSENQKREERFETQKQKMPWCVLPKLSLIKPEAIRYIKNDLKFAKKMIMVPLYSQAVRAFPQNLLDMLWVWGLQVVLSPPANPESLWEGKKFTLELLVNEIDQMTLSQANEGKIICLYGGDDEWIRKFTTAVNEVAPAANISLELVYVGKSNNAHHMEKIIPTIKKQELGRRLDPDSVWLFWTRLERIFTLLSTSASHTGEKDKILKEATTLLGFNGKGWALFCKGSSEMAKINGNAATEAISKFKEWEDDCKKNGFVAALDKYFQEIHPDQHCCHVTLVDNGGKFPDKVKCGECGDTMEKYVTYKCCKE